MQKSAKETAPVAQQGVVLDPQAFAMAKIDRIALNPSSIIAQTRQIVHLQLTMDFIGKGNRKRQDPGTARLRYLRDIFLRFEFLPNISRDEHTRLSLSRLFLGLASLSVSSDADTVANSQKVVMIS